MLVALGCDANRPVDEANRRANPCDAPILEPQPVSIVSLIADPGRYEGKAVVVTGFYKTGFEVSAIYLHEDDARHSIRPNGFWVDGRIPDHLQNRYVTIQGIFTTTEGGHLGAWQGTLCGASALG